MKHGWYLIALVLLRTLKNISQNKTDCVHTTPEYRIPPSVLHIIDVSEVGQGSYLFFSLMYLVRNYTQEILDMAKNKKILTLSFPTND